MSRPAGPTNLEAVLEQGRANKAAEAIDEAVESGELVEETELMCPYEGCERRAHDGTCEGE